MKRVLIILTVLAALGTATATASGAVIVKPVYNSVVSPSVSGNQPSLGVEAYSFNQIGDQVNLAGRKRHLNSVQVEFSSWACESGSWTGSPGPCITDPGATFKAAITLNIYRHAVAGTDAPGERVPGALLLSVTRTMTFPFRPTASNTCAIRGKSGEWYDSTLNACYNGKAKVVLFNHLGRLGVTLPNRIVWGVSYNSDTSGPNPIGGTNSPTDSLNVALTPSVSVGSQVMPGGIWWDTRNAGFSNGLPSFVAGVFNLDGPNGAANDDGFVPAAMFSASKVAS